MGAFGIIGSALAFLVGARLGGALEHHTKAVSVAHMPIEGAPSSVAQR